MEIDESLPYIIGGKEYQDVAVINNEDIVPYKDISSGYIRYKDKVQEVSDLKVQERCVRYDYKVIAIAPFHNCIAFFKNDSFLKKLQMLEELKEDNIYELKNKIHWNKTEDVCMRL